MRKFPRPLKLVANGEDETSGAHLPDAKQLAKNAKNRARELLKELPPQLESLAQQLREAAEAVDNGEVELEDLAWEAELGAGHREGR